MKYKIWMSAVVEVEADNEDDALEIAIEKIVSCEEPLDIDDIEETP